MPPPALPGLCCRGRSRAATGSRSRPDSSAGARLHPGAGASAYTSAGANAYTSADAGSDPRAHGDANAVSGRGSDPAGRERHQRRSALSNASATLDHLPQRPRDRPHHGDRGVSATAGAMRDLLRSRRVTRPWPAPLRTTEDTIPISTTCARPGARRSPRGFRESPVHGYSPH